MSNTTWQDETVQALKQGYQATIYEQAATIARLTAAHEMQGESLVVLPRWMVSNMEDKLKEQAKYIEWANAKIEALERVK
jgi:hypothetical protein